MANYDYTALHELTDTQIIAEVVLLYPQDEVEEHSIEIVLDGMRRFCPPGLKCCFALWGNGLETFVLFPEQQTSPTHEQIVAAFYRELVRIIYDENKTGDSLWN